MNRRQAIARTMMVAVSTMMAGAIPRALNAQGASSSIEYALNPQNWSTQELSLWHRRFAVAFAHLRLNYSPTRHEGGEGFAQGLFDTIRDAFGRDPGDVISAPREVEAALQGMNLRNEIENHMLYQLDRNNHQLNSWLEDIGLAEGRLRIDLLNAQAVFGVFAIVRVGRGETAFAQRFTWIWPFC